MLRLRLRRIDDDGPVDLPEVVCAKQPLVLGRNTSSDVVLPDPDRLVSSAHALIEPAGEGYQVVDTSVNGILLNQEKLPSNTPTPLVSGDVIQIMRYELTVEAESVVQSSANLDVSRASASAGAVAQDPLALLDAELTPAGINTGNINTEDISELLAGGILGDASDGGAAEPESAVDSLHQGSDLESLFIAPQPQLDPALIKSAGGDEQALDWWQEDAPADSATPQADPFGPLSTPSLAADEASLGEPAAEIKPAIDRMPELVDPQPSPSPTTADRNQAPNPLDGPAAVGLDSLLAGLGLPPGTQLTDNQLGQLGEVVRLLLQGVIASVRTRAEVKNQLRMVRTVLQANDNNPLKVAVDVPDALELLFLRPRSGFLDAVTATKATMDDLSAHELAMLAGFRQATRDLRSKISPNEIEESFDSALLSVVGKHRFWDRYVELYERFCREDDYLDETFASAYDEMIRQLEPKA